MEFNSELLTKRFELREPSLGKETFCRACSEVISGEAYCATGLGWWWIHKSCAKLGGKITHPLHPNHTLTLRLLSYPDNNWFVCNGCGDYSLSLTFNCDDGCDYKLDFKCGLLADDYVSKYDLQTLEERNKKANIYHFSHEGHILTLCNAKSHKLPRCACCNQEDITGSVYACLDCAFYIHESCKDQMHEQVETKLHRHHSLRARVIQYSSFSDFEYICCDVCGYSILGFCYRCEECYIYYVHGGCVKYFTRPMKHNCHECKLFYFKHDEWSRNFRCQICGVESGAVYRCLDCDMNFHPECIPLPSVLEFECHDDHPLKLVDSVNRYDCPVYYCDVCEEEVNLRHHLYYCDECPYFAHVDCVISQDDTSPVDSGCEDTTEQDNSLVDSGCEDTKKTRIAENDQERYAENRRFEYPEKAMMEEEASLWSDAERASFPMKATLELNFDDFAHLLTLREPGKKAGTLCFMCREVITGQAYTFIEKVNAIERKQHWIHESCAKLPRKIIHPLHPHHPLTLLSKTPNNHAGRFICNGCGYFCTSYTFNCQLCPFNLDLKCGSLMNLSFSKYNQDRKRYAKFHRYFGHDHILRLCNFRKSQKLYCDFCEQIIYGSAYSCFHCEFFIHESCKDKRQVNNQFHPQHSLFACKKPSTARSFCRACGSKVRNSFCFSCEECQFDLHVTCNKPSTRPLKHECHHQCDLFYFSYHEWREEFLCQICRKRRKTAVYRCVNCCVNFHLDCIPLPNVPEVKCTSDHTLKLVDSLTGHDFPGYYCDVCEEEGISEDHLYYCEICPYFAHIDCILPQEFKLTVAIFGTKNAGKTSLVNVVATGAYSEDTIPMTEPTMTKVTKGNIIFELWDVGGQPNYKWEQYCDSVFAIVYVVDAARRHYSLENSKVKLHNLLGRPKVRSSNVPLLVLGNKIDQAGALSKVDLTKKMGLKFISDREVCCLMVSCKNLINVDSVFSWFVKRLELNNQKRHLSFVESN